MQSVSTKVLYLYLQQSINQYSKVHIQQSIFIVLESQIPIHKFSFSGAFLARGGFRRGKVSVCLATGGVAATDGEAATGLRGITVGTLGLLAGDTSESIMISGIGTETG